MKHKLLSSILALSMVFAMLPTVALAAAAAAVLTVAVDEEGAITVTDVDSAPVETNLLYGIVETDPTAGVGNLMDNTTITDVTSTYSLTSSVTITAASNGKWLVVVEATGTEGSETVKAAGVEKIENVAPVVPEGFPTLATEYLPSGLSLSGTTLVGTNLVPGINAVPDAVHSLFYSTEDPTSRAKWDEVTDGTPYTIVTINVPVPTEKTKVTVVQTNPALGAFYGEGKLIDDRIKGNVKTTNRDRPSTNGGAWETALIALPNTTITLDLYWGSTGLTDLTGGHIVHKTYTFQVGDLFAAPEVPAEPIQKLNVNAGIKASGDGPKAGEQQFYAITTEAKAKAITKWTNDMTQSDASRLLDGLKLNVRITEDVRYAVDSYLVLVNVNTETQLVTAAGSAKITAVPVDPDAPETPEDPEKPTDPEAPVVPEKPGTSVDVGGSTSITGSNAVVKPTTSAVTVAIETAKASDNTNVVVAIAATAPTASGAVKTVLSAAVQDALIDGKVDALRVTSGPVAAQFPLDVLSTIRNAAKGEVTFSVEPANTRELEGLAVSIIGNRPLYDFTLTRDNNNTITDFDGDTIEITMPYTLRTNEEAEALCAVYVDGFGNASVVPGSYYDTDLKAVVFDTDHFSTFGIGDHTMFPKTDEENTTGGTVVGNQGRPSGPAVMPNQTFVQNPIIFTDVPDTHWARGSVDFVSARGIMTGSGDGLFSPSVTMTRGMFVTTLGRMAQVDVAQFTGASFSDVAADSYYAPYVLWASQRGIVSGVGDNKFAPDRPVTRQELATMIAGYMKALSRVLPYAQATVEYADGAAISAFAAESVRAVQQSGIMTGKTADTFDPQGIATRAEVATVVMRLATILGIR